MPKETNIPKPDPDIAVIMRLDQWKRGAVKYGEPNFIDKTGPYLIGGLHIRSDLLPKSDTLPKEIEVTVRFLP